VLLEVVERLCERFATCDSMEQIEEVLEVLRSLKRRRGGPLPLKVIFRSLIEDRICESNKSVSNCLQKLRSAGKIRTVNSGVDIEFLEDVKPEYVQSSLGPFRKRL